MSSRKRIAALLATAITVAAVAAIWLLHPARLNPELRRRGIPPLPEYERLIGIEKGGFFAGWFFAAVSVSPSALERYERILASDCDRQLPMGDRKGCVKIVTEYPPDAPSISEGPELRLKRGLHGGYIPWWRTDLIRRGALYEKTLPDSCGYAVLVDRERNVVYIYWHYS